MIRTLIAGLLLGFVTTLSGTAMAAEKAVEFRFSHFLPAKYILFQKGSEGSYADWMKSITEASGGTITFKVFPTGQLGGGKDHYNLAAKGVADIAFVNPGYTPGRFPVIALGEIPLTFKDAISGSAALWDWYRDLASAEMPDVKVLNSFISPAGTIHSNRPVKQPNDLKGMKVRPGNATVARFVSSLGGTNVQVPIMDSRDALARGLVDATTMGFSSLMTFRQNKLVKYHLNLPLYSITFVTAMNKKSYDRLSARQKKVMADHGTPQWSQKIIAAWAQKETKGLSDMMADGNEHHLHQPAGANLTAWKNATAPLNAAWRKSVSKKTSLNPDNLVKNFRASLDKYHAGQNVGAP